MAAPSARRAIARGDETDHRSYNATATSSGWRHQPAPTQAFMTPDAAHHTNGRREADWHYQETPPAQIQHGKHPYAGQQGVYEATTGNASGCKTPEPTVNDRALSQQQQQPMETAAEYAQSQFRRRNRLEQRLEELQKDVASLTLKLRSGSNRSTSTTFASTDKQTPPLTEIPLTAARVNRSATGSQQQQQHPAPAPPRSGHGRTKKSRSRSILSEHSTTPTKGRSAVGHVSTLRELHKVTTERDQLRFELEKTKRTLASTERKYAEAVKAREALEKLKAHCESLQESLELSEKIRVRQKKLLQQQQQQTLAPTRLNSAPPVRQTAVRETATAAVPAPGRARAPKTSAATTSARTHRSATYDQPPFYEVAATTRQDAPLDDVNDILDTLVAPRTRRGPAPAPRTSYARPSTAPPAAAPSTYTYADFDSLLQRVHSPHPIVHALGSQHSRRGAAPGAGTATTGASTNTRSRAVATAAATGSKRPMRSKSQGPPLHRTGTASTAPSTARPTRHFLAPTQASLQRKPPQRRSDDNRRPFL